MKMHSNWSAEVDRQISEHLEAIDRALAAQKVEFAQRRNVIGDVETHIVEAVTARGLDAPTVADIQAVLAELDPPSSYGDIGAVNIGRIVRPQVSRMAIIGAIWAPWFPIVFILLFHVKSVAGNPPPPTAFDHLLAYASLAVGLGAPVGTTLLGLLALSQIRLSDGSLYGLSLALVDALLYLLVALEALICAAVYHIYAIVASISANGWNALARPDNSAADRNFGVVLVFGALISMAVDWSLVRRAWRAVRIPVRAD